MRLLNEVPLFNPKAVNAGFALESAVTRVLQRHWYVLGEEVRQFETAFAAYCGVPYCVTLANGTDAIEFALRGLGIGPGDRVILAANAGFYGSTAVQQLGAQAVYVDVDPVTLCLSVSEVERVLATQSVKAIVATHLYGQMADVEALATLAQMHKVPLVEDCAQAHGARRRGSIVGSIGDVGCFSFYPTKNLGAVGDGGAVTCRNPDLAARIRSLRQYGWVQKYQNDLPGGRNSRLDEMQAAVLNEKLPALDSHNAARREIALLYREAFTRLPIQLPASFGEDYVAHLFVIRLPQRDDLRAHLQSRGILSDVHYPVPDHLQRVASSEQHVGSLPYTEEACAQVLSLPCYPGMPVDSVRKVIDAVCEFFNSAKKA